MTLLVQKFGGTSLGSIERIKSVAQRIKTSKDKGDDLVVVVSAMGHTTDQLTKLASEITIHPSHREMDMLLSTGEQVSISLLTMALHELGIPAIGISGIDGGMIVTKKREKNKDETGALIDYGYVGDISSVNMDILNTQLDAGYIPIISSLTADADGVILNVNADTIAATIAYELSAEKLILMTSVPGILMDKNDKTSLISYINHDSLKKMKSNGKLTDGMLPKADAIGLALDNGVSRVHIISSNSEDSLLTEIFTNHGTGTLIVKDLTNLTSKEQIGESNEAAMG